MGRFAHFYRNIHILLLVFPPIWVGHPTLERYSTKEMFTMENISKEGYGTDTEYMDTGWKNVNWETQVVHCVRTYFVNTIPPPSPPPPIWGFTSRQIRPRMAHENCFYRLRIQQKQERKRHNIRLKKFLT